MADNYLEKRMELYRSNSGATSSPRTKEGLAALLLKNRSTRGYDASYQVRADQLRRIVCVNCKLASARNRQVLRFRLVAADEAHKVLPFIRMGAGLKELHLPIQGTEPNAFIVVCSTIEPRNSTFVDLGISAQSMLLQAVEMGLNGLCIMDFDGSSLVEALQLPYKPLLVVAIGKSAETVRLVDIKENDDYSYYRKDGVHYVPKVVVEDLMIK
ncbi:MAG: nitroreductase family protein [Bacteroidaceae bacterium]|nr:nitroreductase family protein [Bacteroidaceae bacterium]